MLTLQQISNGFGTPKAVIAIPHLREKQSRIGRKRDCFVGYMPPCNDRVDGLVDVMALYFISNSL